MKDGGNFSGHAEKYLSCSLVVLILYSVVITMLSVVLVVAVMFSVVFILCSQ